MEILYEGVLDDLIIHQKELSMSERIKLVQIISNYILPKSKSVRDDITLEKIKHRNKELFSEEPKPYKVAATFIKASA